MVAFGHTGVGTLIGFYAYEHLHTLPLPEGLALTAGLGIVSHFVFDFIPHGHFFDESKYKSKVLKDIIFDLFLSIVLSLGIVFLKQGLSPIFWYLLFGIGGSQLPDILDGLIYIGFLPSKGFLKKEHSLHQAVHWHGTGIKTLPWRKQDVWQLALFLLSLAVLLKI